MDLSRLSQGEKISLGSGALLFIFVFLFKWFGIDIQAAGISLGSASLNAWDTLEWIRWVLLISALAAVVFPLLKASGNDLEIPVPPSTIITLLGGLSVLFILFRIIDPPGELGREIGVFLGLIAAAGVAYGGYTSMQEEGTTFQDAADHFSNPSDPGGPPPPPPPANPGA